jgi:hypothetical protein
MEIKVDLPCNTSSQYSSKIGTRSGVYIGKKSRGELLIQRELLIQKKLTSRGFSKPVAVVHTPDISGYPMPIEKDNLRLSHLVFLPSVSYHWKSLNANKSSEKSATKSAYLDKQSFCRAGGNVTGSSRMHDIP